MNTMKITPREMLGQIDSYDPNKWYLVVTVAQSTSSEELLRHLRSKLKQLLEDTDIHSQLKYQLPEIERTIFEYIRQNRTSERTQNTQLCVVFSFSLSDLSRAKLDTVADLITTQAILVDHDLIDSCTLAHVPDFTLVYSTASNGKALFSDNKQSEYTVTFTPEKADLYKGMDTSSAPIITFENKYDTPEHNRYYEKVSFSSSQSIRHGTGSEKYHRVTYAGWLLFIRKTLEAIQKEHTPKEIQVVFSQAFKPLKKQLKTTVATSLNAQEVGVYYISSDIFSDIDEIIPNEESRKYQDNSSEMRLINTHQAVKALRQGRVETLYVNPELDNSGYISPDGVCYTYPVKGSKKVDEIRPWLLKLATEKADKLVVDDRVSTVSAVERYQYS